MSLSTLYPATHCPKPSFYSSLENKYFWVDEDIEDEEDLEEEEDVDDEGEEEEEQNEDWNHY